MIFSTFSIVSVQGLLLWNTKPVLYPRNISMCSQALYTPWSHRRPCGHQGLIYNIDARLLPNTIWIIWTLQFITFTLCI